MPVEADAVSLDFFIMRFVMTQNRHKYLVKDKRDGKFKLRYEFSNYTIDIYDGESENLYEILTHYQEKYEDAWIDVRIGDAYGHLMKIDEWIEFCEDGLFMNGDGSGSPLDENFHFIGSSILPSQRNDLTPKLKYILWFNK